MLVLLAVLLAAGRAFAQQQQSYANECRIRFQVPTGWMAQKLAPNKTDYKNSICVIRLQPHNLSALIREAGGVDVYTIEVSVVTDDLEHAAVSGGFKKRRNEWLVLGRTGIESPAKAISSSQWIGVKGTATVGCFYEDGRGYAGLCDAPVAVLNNWKRLSAIIDANPRSEDEFEAVLKSFHFLR